MRITFWGVRGSIPVPGLATSRYGGNTPCVTLGEGPGVLILDAGSGIRAVGRRLTAVGHYGPIDLLISHAHIDHLQGLPFFAPIHAAGAQVHIYGPRPDSLSLHESIARLMSPPYWPAHYAPIAARLDVTEITAADFQTEYFRVRVLPLCHPGRTLGFAVASLAGGQIVNYMTDNELGAWTGMPDWQEELVGFLRNTDLLIHDATYGDDEIQERSGWGHSSASQAVDLAVAAGVRRLILFHHAPEHDDDDVDRILREARRRAAATGTPLVVDAAVEGLTFDI